jgi:serine/threonine-protein kinase HipA
MPVDIRQRVLSLAVDEADSTASLELAFRVAKQFGLKEEEARRIAAEVGKAVSRWRETASKLGLSSNEIARMESAFEHEDLRIACNAE